MKRLSAILLLMFLSTVPAVKLRAQGTGQILHAEYGADSNWVDVTQRVGSMLRHNNASFRIRNATFGVDPAVGQEKSFRLVVREANGRLRHVVFVEGTSIKLHGYTFDSSSKGLRILGAEYGAGGRVADVTRQLDALMKAGQLTMLANNQTLGGDPAPSQPKTLTVWYTLNGLTAQVVVAENGYLTMPGGNGFADYVRNDQGKSN